MKLSVAEKNTLEELLYHAWSGIAPDYMREEEEPDLDQRVETTIDKAYDQVSADVLDARRRWLLEALNSPEAVAITRRIVR